MINYNFIKTINNFIEIWSLHILNILTNKKTFTTKNISLNRLNICKTCNKYNNGICKICHCIMHIKVKLLYVKCPDNKWS